MNRIVLFTGSFNPVTKAHRILLESAVNKVNADMGLFICTNDKYLTKKMVVDKKSKQPFVLSEDLRKSLILSLTDVNPKLGFGGFELGGASPATGKTVRSIMKKYKNTEFYYLAGADKLKGIPRWTSIESMFENLSIIVYPRSDIDIENVIASNELLSKYKDKIIILDQSSDTVGVSSTAIRDRFFNSLDYSEYMDESAYKILKQLSPSDFKEITDEDIIKDTIIYGGRFSGNLARNLVYKSNTKLFRNWDTSLLGDRDHKILDTKVYTKPFTVNSNNNYETVIECENIDCVEFALRLKQDGYNPAILNLASNKHPCGGYDKGMGAQEESLCQMSTLSQSLYQFGNPKLKYFKDANVRNVPGVYPMDMNYGGIYSPDVCFFRNNIDKYYSLRDKPFSCGVITVASLSNRQSNEWTNDEAIYFNEDGYLNSVGKEIETNKIRTIYRIALENGHDSIVLGAFGCGVYHLRSDEVSMLFYNVSKEPEFNNKFKKLVFAIFEGKGSSRKVVGEFGKYKPFYDLRSK